MTSDADMQELNAFIDGELALSEQLAMEARINQDAALRAELQNMRQLREHIRGNAEYHAAPELLRVGLQRLATPSAPARQAQREPNRWRWFAWQPFAIGLISAALLMWGLGVTSWPGGHEERLLQDVVASHVRATLGQRLVDVASSDQHTVKPWLSSRLDFSPAVPDAQPVGVNFLGGRVDYLDGHPVAVLVYRQRDHVVDVFVWPTPDADAAVRSRAQRGFNVAHWSKGSMTYWAVSDLNADELTTLARAIERTQSAK